jgi:hypothetical protein
MNQYLRNNGLVAGKIPAQTNCPFLGKCVVEHSDCPSQSNTKDEAYDCPVARMQSLIILKFKREE